MASLARAGDAVDGDAVEAVPKLQAKLKKRWVKVACLATLRERAEQEAALDRAWFELMKSFGEEGDEASPAEVGDVEEADRAWLELMTCFDEEGDEAPPAEESE